MRFRSLTPLFIGLLVVWAKEDESMETNDEEEVDETDDNQFVQLYKKFKPALALSNSVSLEEWTKALPNENEKNEMMQVHWSSDHKYNHLIATLYPMKNFSGVDLAMFKRMFPNLSKTVNLTVIDNLYCVIHEPFEETPNYKFPRFFGFAVITAEAAVRTRLHHSASHYQTDGPVCLQASALYGSTGSKSLVIAGASRYAVKGFAFLFELIHQLRCSKHLSACQSKESIADASHNTDLMFHIINVALLQAARNSTRNESGGLKDSFIQWHGMAETSCANSTAFISVGVRGNHSIYNNENTLANKLKSAVNSIAGSDFAQTPRTDTKCTLRATTNVFGRLINDVPLGDECEKTADSNDINGNFLHIEQKQVSRRNLTLWENAFDVISSAEKPKNGGNDKSVGSHLTSAFVYTFLTVVGLLAII
ncbi:hypothetical protein M3Y95_00299600 [Aphelenchoides besseyi]|nr:hypothetical protein M3Y95_00299600 [Aphelenchoides besseyi]